MAKKAEPVCLAGDFNVAPTERDIFHWKSNQKTSGFSPMNASGSPTCCNADGTTRCVIKRGECDGPYTWWSNRGQARAADRGWRIDHWLLNDAAKCKCSRRLSTETTVSVCRTTPL